MKILTYTFLFTLTFISCQSTRYYVYNEDGSRDKNGYPAGYCVLSIKKNKIKYSAYYQRDNNNWTFPEEPTGWEDHEFMFMDSWWSANGGVEFCPWSLYLRNPIYSADKTKNRSNKIDNYSSQFMIDITSDYDEVSHRKKLELIDLSTISYSPLETNADSLIRTSGLVLTFFDHDWNGKIDPNSPVKIYMPPYLKKVKKADFKKFKTLEHNIFIDLMKKSGYKYPEIESMVQYKFPDIDYKNTYNSFVKGEKLRKKQKY